jgi:hypothetical protein
MKTMRLFQFLLAILLLAVCARPAKAAPLGTEFLYQGLLSVNGSPANGAYDIRFTLFRVGETAAGPSLTLNNVPVRLGVFTVRLDFGQGVFDGTAYELGLAVREAGGGGTFVALQPRQPLAATPNATFAQSVGLVPDSALSGNVALLNASPVFTTGISVTMLRVADSSGAGQLKFGPTDDCTIGVAPQGPTGLLLRDPRGIRILSPDPMSPPILRFGPTDDCSLGIDPAFPGLVERDPIGFRLLGLNNQGCRLIFGPTMDCTVEIDPAGPMGLLLRDPKGVRIVPRDPAALPILRFGPTDDCSIGIDPAFPGLVERDPIGFRLLGRDNQGCRLIFGPTMDCTVEVDPAGPQGLLLRDPRGIRILPPVVAGGAGLPRLLFGPTDDCSIGIDPAFPGLVERDPIGFRLLGQNNEGCRLLFGPTDLCTIEVQPPNVAGSIPGLLLRDPSGIRILSPDPVRPPTLRFGPTDDCSLGIDPVLTGLILRDPRGVRIAPAAATALPRLLFGPTDDCSIGIDPAFPGLVERDPFGFRLLGRNNEGCRLLFGPTDLCTIEVQPPNVAGSIPGLLLRDPSGIRVLSPDPQRPPTLLFGPTDDCSIGIDPVLAGLRLRDPGGLRIAPIDPMALPRLLFGPTDDCSIGIDPAFPGLVERDPFGFRLLGRNNEGCRLLFGPTDLCTIEVQPPSVAGSIPGLLLRDPSGIRILSPDPVRPPTLRFGPTDDCSIGIDPAFPGLVERDPFGFRLLGRNNEGCRLLFGPTDLCTIEVQPPNVAGSIPGLLLRDPRGIRLLNPEPQAPSTLLFGPTDQCRITAPGPNGGMGFSDPRGFTFSGQVVVNGSVFAQEFVPISSRRFKHDVKPIEQPLEKIAKLQGVRFTWTEEKGGGQDLGFIAEEVAKVVPEVVAWEDDGQNARGVNYDHLVAVTVEGIKAQQTQIQTLEREKAELKASLNAMQAQLERLSQKLEALAAR